MDDEGCGCVIFVGVLVAVLWFWLPDVTLYIGSNEEPTRIAGLLAIPLGLVAIAVIGAVVCGVVVACGFVIEKAFGPLHTELTETTEQLQKVKRLTGKLGDKVKLVHQNMLGLPKADQVGANDTVQALHRRLSQAEAIGNEIIERQQQIINNFKRNVGRADFHRLLVAMKRQHAATVEKRTKLNQEIWRLRKQLTQFLPMEEQAELNTKRIDEMLNDLNKSFNKPYANKT